MFYYYTTNFIAFKIEQDRKNRNSIADGVLLILGDLSKILISPEDFYELCEAIDAVKRNQESFAGSYEIVNLLTGNPERFHLNGNRCVIAKHRLDFEDLKQLLYAIEDLKVFAFDLSKNWLYSETDATLIHFEGPLINIASHDAAVVGDIHKFYFMLFRFYKQNKIYSAKLEDMCIWR